MAFCIIQWIVLSILQTTSPRVTVLTTSNLVSFALSIPEKFENEVFAPKEGSKVFGGHQRFRIFSNNFTFQANQDKFWCLGPNIIKWKSASTLVEPALTLRFMPIWRWRSWKVLFTLRHIPSVYCLNPLSPNSAQNQFSPNDIHRLSWAKSMRINKMISNRKIFDLLPNSFN